jgi:hypothetical protein
MGKLNPMFGPFGCPLEVVSACGQLDSMRRRCEMHERRVEAFLCLMPFQRAGKVQAPHSTRIFVQPRLDPSHTSQNMHDAVPLA